MSPSLSSSPAAREGLRLMSVVRSATYSADTPISGLRTAEMYVVCAARLWLAHYKGAPGAARDLDRGFAMAGVAEDGLVGLCRFFDAVAAAAGRSLDIRCVKCPRLGKDEAALLQMVAHLHHGVERGAVMLLEDWLPRSAVRIALAPLAAFAAALTEAGLVVLRRHSEAVDPALASATASATAASVTACPDRGVALIH